MRFVTIFPQTENVHLLKDVGMIPFVLHEKFRYDSIITTYDNSKYSYLSNEVKNLKINFLRKYTNNEVVDVCIYILKNAKQIDILHLFHLRKKIIIWIFIYKLLNRNGKVYLKLDCGRSFKNSNFDLRGLKNMFRKSIIKKCTLISAETKEAYDYINEHWPIKVELIPNGFKKDVLRKIKPEEKENYIITVGRIGSKEKANEVLMEAFANVHCKIPGWKLKLVGPIEESFKPYIESYFKEHKDLKDKVIFTGAIYDKEKLDYEYRKAKIFCLTSPKEGFPLVFLEAIKNGCYIVSSDVSSVADVTNNFKYGDIFDVGNIEQLSNLLIKKCKYDITTYSLFAEIQKFAYDKFDWNIICEKIHSLLN